MPRIRIPHLPIRFAERAGRLVLFVFLLYAFLVAIDLFGDAIKLVGKDTAKGLFSGLQNPFAGLAVGILATVLVQSSSVTTSTIVAMVGSGTLPLEYAVPMVMGANVGTSITNTLVSLGHVTQDAPFRRAFAGATVHDMFNLLAVVTLLPLELATGILRRGAQTIVEFIPRREGGGATFKSPIKAAVSELSEGIATFFRDLLGIGGAWLAVVLCITALALIVMSLWLITRNMKLLIADKIEEWLNRVLGKSGLLGLGIGLVITMIVQSSSITTSLLVPLFGAGVLRLEAGYPLMLGANVGTTVTAMLAATVAGPAGITVAVIHLLFNVSGILLFFPVRRMRLLPIRMAERLAEAAATNRLWVIAYIVGVFFVAPILGILIWKS